MAYLDNAATTPLRPEAREAMLAIIDQGLGNPSSAHEQGKRAKVVLEQARATVAECLGVEPDEVYFTSGATESNNLAIRGICDARDLQLGLITSTLEHASVTKPVRDQKRKGRPVSYIGAKGGNFDFAALEQALEVPTALVSVMTVQNETGFVMPIEQICDQAHQAQPTALVHSDCTQAFGKMPLDIPGLNLDLATISSHKIGGPTGVGALYVKRGTQLFSTALGGGQERGLRSGTEPVYALAGFAAAARAAVAQQEQAFQHAAALKQQLIQQLTQINPGITINSRNDGSPFIVSFTIPESGHGEMLGFLSEQGVYVSRASACSELYKDVPADQWRPKHPVSLTLAGVPATLLSSTFRVSFSAATTTEDITALTTGVARWVAQKSN